MGRWQYGNLGGVLRQFMYRIKTIFFQIQVMLFAAIVGLTVYARCI